MSHYWDRVGGDASRASLTPKVVVDHNPSSSALGATLHAVESAGGHSKDLADVSSVCPRGVRHYYHTRKRFAGGITITRVSGYLSGGQVEEEVGWGTQ